MREKRYDVFISYSSKDSHIAFMLCDALENKGITCWIAPRDVKAGQYANSIVEGIESSQLFVLLFSENSNKSTPVLNELEMAMGNKLLIIPARIEEILPSKGMKFYLMATHWFDILQPKSMEDFDNFVRVVQNNLDGESEVSIQHFQNRKVTKKRKLFSFPKYPIIIPSIIIISLYIFFKTDKTPTNTHVAILEKNITNKALSQKLIQEIKEKEHWKEEFFKLKEKYKDYPNVIAQADKIKEEKGFEEAVSFFMEVKVHNKTSEVYKNTKKEESKEIKKQEGATDKSSQMEEKIIEEENQLPKITVYTKKYPKKALLIANYSYKKVPKLQDPSKSLNILENTLKELDFNVTTKKNLNKEEIEKAIKEFSKELSKNPNSIGLIYYSGHGYQVNNESYLIPIDIKYNSKQIKHTAFNTKKMLNQLSNAQNKLNIYFLDTFLNTEEYIPPIPKNTIVMYASSGKVISPDNNSFITSINRQIKKPSNLNIITSNIRQDIAHITNNTQIPIILSNYIPPIKLSHQTNITISKIFNLSNKNQLLVAIESKTDNTRDRAFCKNEILTIEIENIEESEYLVIISLNNEGKLIIIQPDPKQLNQTSIIETQVIPPFGIDNLKVFALKNKLQFDKILELSKQSPNGILNTYSIEKLYNILISDKSFREQEAHVLTIDTCLKGKL